jgi:hypothetical protein
VPNCTVFKEPGDAKKAKKVISVPHLEGVSDTPLADYPCSSKKKGAFS